MRFGFIALASLLASALAQSLNHTEIVKRAVQQTYVVHFKPGTPRSTQQAHVAWMYKHTQMHHDGKVRQGVKRVYAGKSAAYSAVLPAHLARAVRSRPEVHRVEAVQASLSRPTAVYHRQRTPAMRPRIAKLAQRIQVTAKTVQSKQSGLEFLPSRGWNAARVSHQRYTSGYSPGIYVRSKFQGQGVHVYVLDSGVASLADFPQGSLYIGKNFVRGTTNADVSGHGTMVAALISSKSHGLAPQSVVTSVKVTNDANIITSDDLIAAVEYVIEQPGENNMKIISLSQYFPWNYSVNQIMQTALDKGVHVVVAAGNDGHDACSYSPGAMSAKSAVITVGSIDGRNSVPIRGRDTNLEGSNIGSCVSIFAPGSRVPTLANRALPPNTNYFGYGTSVATPQVAAMAAVTLSELGAMSPEALKKILLERAVKGQIYGNLGGSKGGILWNGLA
jgi:subtilisin family serine protease